MQLKTLHHVAKLWNMFKHVAVPTYWIDLEIGWDSEIEFGIWLSQANLLNWEFGCHSQITCMCASENIELSWNLAARAKLLNMTKNMMGLM